MSTNEKMVSNILFYTQSPFNLDCGGLVVQYYLCSILKFLGSNVKIYAPKQIQNHIFNDYYNDDLDLNKTLVIYAETIQGNPINAPNVLRWILAPLGKIADIDIWKTWGPNDLVYFFNHDDSIYEKSLLKQEIYKQLTCIYINPKIRNNKLPRQRKYCHAFRRNKIKKDHKIAPPVGSLEITRNNTQDDCINIFNRTHAFICYDLLTFLAPFAALCGCASVIVKNGFINRQQWIKTLAIYPYLRDNNLDRLYGIAYGIDELKWAKQSLHLVKDQWSNIQKYMINKTVLPLLDDIRNFENCKNTVQNIYMS